MSSEKDPRLVASGPGRLPSNTVGANAFIDGGPGGSLAWVKSRIENVQAEIDALRARVDGHDGEIDDIKDRLDDLENEVADLVDRLDYLDPDKSGIRRIRTVATLADLKAVADPQDGDFIHCAELGTFRYDAAKVLSQDNQTVVRPNGVVPANPGRWILSNYGQLRAPNGTATLDSNSVVVQPVTKVDRLDTLDDLRAISTEFVDFVRDRFKHVGETETVYRYDNTVSGPDNGLSVIKPLGVDVGDFGRWVPIEYRQRALPHGLATIDEDGWLGQIPRNFQFVSTVGSGADAIRNLDPNTSSRMIYASGWTGPLDHYGAYYYDPYATGEDNGRSVIRPNSVGPGDPGRWVSLDYFQRNAPWGVPSLDGNGRLRVRRRVATVTDNHFLASSFDFDIVAYTLTTTSTYNCNIPIEGSHEGDVLRVVLLDAPAHEDAKVIVRIFDGPALEFLGRESGDAFNVDLVFIGGTWTVLATSMMP